jgi:hypothetical protein
VKSFDEFIERRFEAHFGRAPTDLLLLQNIIQNLRNCLVLRFLHRTNGFRIRPHNVQTYLGSAESDTWAPDGACILASLNPRLRRFVEPQPLAADKPMPAAFRASCHDLLNWKIA